MSARRILSWLIGALALLALAAPAMAMPSWLSPEDLSAPGSNTENPAVALDPSGNAFAVWPLSLEFSRVVQSSRYDASTGTWGAPRNLSAGQSADSPQVAVDAAGNALAVWSRFDGADSIIQASRYDAATGAWSTPEDLSAAGREAFRPQVALDSAGNAFVVWTVDNAPGNVVQAARYDAATGGWGSPENLSAASSFSFQPRVAVDSAGNALAAWSLASTTGTNDIVQAARYDAATGSWGSPEDLSAAGISITPQIAVDAAGNAVAVWHRFDGANNVIQASRYEAATGSWGAPENLSAPSQIASESRVALDPAGNAIALWTRSDGANTIVQAARYDAATGGWGAPTNRSAAGQSASQPQVALDASGNALAVWWRSDGTKTIIQAARYDAATGAWGATENLSAAGQDAGNQALSVNPSGDAFAVWNRGDTNSIVQAAGFDATPPTITQLLVPGSAGAYERVVMSVAASDPFGLGGTRWDFGDGGVFDPGVHKPNAQRTYTAPGTYTVTVTQRDLVGNETARSAQITIAPRAALVQAAAPPAPSARCAGSPATIVGTPGRDVITGTPRADVIHALAGNDLVRGLGGNDLICLGSGNDRGIGGGGADVLLGQRGNDRLDGSSGNDRLLGGRGNDRMRGLRGNDRHTGGAGRDVALGGPGNDRLDGGGANDRLFGGSGRDVLLGRSGRDVLAGGSGRDLALGGAGNDRLFGNGAADRLDGGRGRRDLASGGSGADRCIRAEIVRSC